jgi:hypothetical protein
VDDEAGQLRRELAGASKSQVCFFGEREERVGEGGRQGGRQGGREGGRGGKRKGGSKGEEGGWEEASERRRGDRRIDLEKSISRCRRAGKQQA